MRSLSLALITCLIFSACQTKNWVADKTVSLNNISPIGIAYDGEHVWLSDGDNNKVVQISKSGEQLRVLDGYSRPMHICYDEGKLYIPQYTTDLVSIFDDNKNGHLVIDKELDAPAGVAVNKNKIAIADFYNHRVLLKNGNEWQSIGKKGRNDDGDFHYPTDVEFENGKLYVADAYNNRIQVFSDKGKHLLTFGREHKMNATTGIYIKNGITYATDFENDRVLIFDENGNLIQTLTEGLDKPTDLIIIEDVLYVINYKGKSISLFK